MKRRWIAAASALVVVGAVGWWWRSGLEGVDGSLKLFTIEPSESRAVVAQRLKDDGIIRSPVHFLLYSYLTRSTMIAGTFTLNPTSRVSEVVAVLATKSRREQSVTIPEGWRREQVARLMAQKGVPEDEFLAATVGLEGKLFPDTYFISIEPTTADVVAKLTANFAAKTNNLQLDEATLILASIVEREAKRDDERGLIAGIYAGRLKDQMRLEADPTVQYGRDSNLIAAGSPPDEFWKPIRVADYQGVISPYNTYRRNGLPPGPIASPGLKSIAAALHPETTSARYFFHRSNGDIVTSRTLDEHNRNKAKYLQ